MRNQRTIADRAEVKGVGYWGGQDVRLEFRPAEVDTGIVFVRSDLEDCPRIAASVGNCAGTARRTNLTSAGAGVDMVEHVMAALAGLQIDNCEVWSNQQEMPGCDGSSLPFVEALSAAGPVEQQATRRQIVIRRTIRVGDERSWIEARPARSAHLAAQPATTTLAYKLDYGSDHPIGRQSLEISLSPESFREELAASRTYLLEAEAVAFRARGLGQRTTCKDLLVFGPYGPIDNQLRCPDECVRHKLLDMVGDLALAGCELLGQFRACRSGHQLNVELATALLAEDARLQALKRCA